VAQKVTRTPLLPNPVPDARTATEALTRALFQGGAEQNQRLNGSFPMDGTEDMQAPVPLYATETPDLPDPVEWEGSTMYDATLGQMVYSNGVAWLPVPGGAITNAELADMVQATLKGRADGAGTGPPQDLTGAQAVAILPQSDLTARVLDASVTQKGVLEVATDAQVAEAEDASELALVARHLEDAAVPFALTDAATIALDWTDAAANFEVTLTANRVLGNPSNAIPGQWRTVYVDGSSGTPRTLTFGSNYGGDVPTVDGITTTVSWLLSIFCVTTSHFLVSAMEADPP
jgi:hypothetical protein